MFRCHLQCIQPSFSERMCTKCILKLAQNSFRFLKSYNPICCTHISAFPAESGSFGVLSQTLRGETSPSFWGHKDTCNRVKVHKDPLLRKGDLAWTRRSTWTSF